MRELNSLENFLIYAQFGIAILGLVYAYWLGVNILKEPKGSEKMQTVWNYIRTGANAYLRSQLRIIVTLVLVLMVALFFSVFVVKPTPYAIEHFCPEIAEEVNASLPIAASDLLAVRTETTYQREAAIVARDAECPTARNMVAFGRAGAFLMGAAFSAAVGFFGMNMAVQGNVRVAAAALDPKRGYAAAMLIAYRSGTITGMLTDGLGLFGGTIIFLIFGTSSPDVLLGYGFGATLLALFMRVGGGIYTKAADVGADLVGKVEAGLPEDDPRNAAVIADLVGDNVGDCAGMAADIFESYEVAIVSALILGLAMATITGSPIFFIFPMFVRAIGVFCSVVSTYFVKSSEGGDALAALTRGFYNAAALSVVLFTAFTFFYMKDAEAMGDIVIWQPLVLVIVGIVLAMVIDRVTALFTDTAHGAVKEIARNAQTGPATVVLSGLSNGMESSVWAILVIAAAVLSSVLLFAFFPITNAANMTLPLVDNFTMVAYGVAMVGVGLLTLTGNNVSMDAFGPISDNAQGIAELAGEENEAGNKILGQLDAVGNTTKAITKGVAIASAVIAAVALFSAFMTDTRVVEIGLGVASNMTLAARGINIADPTIFIGFLIGGAMIFMVSALLIRSVNRAAFQMIGVVRKQLKVPGVMEGTVTPDYAECVDVSTRAAQRELIPIGIIAIFTPIVVGLFFNAAALGGFLAGIILTGQLMAVFMSNAGGAWDNAKKYIEDGHYGGKRSEPHKAAVVGDTIGDPFKDTAGPALNPMIKVVNLVALLTAPIVVTIYGPNGDPQTQMLARIVALVLTVIIFGAIFMSKREDPETLKLAEAAAASTKK